MCISNQERILIGAIGLSGKSVENDHAVATVGSEAMGLSTLANLNILTAGAHTLATVGVKKASSLPGLF